MNSLKVLSFAAAMSLALAAPTASFAQTKWAGPGGGGKVAVGGGGGAHIGGGGGFRAGGGGGVPSAGAIARAPGAGFGGGVAGPRFSAGSGYQGGYAGHRHHHHHRHGGGFVPGLVIGGALASSYGYYGSPGYYGSYGYYDDGYDDDGAVAVAPGADDVEYCRQRYRSYDVRTGTYLGNDGLRHACP